MHEKNTWLIVAFRPKFETLEGILGGDSVRPYELFTNLVKQGHRIHIWETEGSPESTRDYLDGHLVVRPLKSLKGTLGQFSQYLAIKRTILAEKRWASENGYSKYCFYQQIPAAVVFRMRCIPIFTQLSILALPYAKALGFFIWATVHDISPDHEIASKKRSGKHTKYRLLGLKSKIGAWMQNKYLPLADFVTTVSNPLISVLNERHAVAKEKLALFPSGVNPEILAPVSAWNPPSSTETWRIGYLGSPRDVSLELIIQSVRALKRNNVELVLAGKGTAEMVDHLRELWPQVEVVEGVRYLNYADIANRIDLWVIVFDDDYCIDYSWQLKNPMALASGRPVVRTDGRAMQESGFAEHFFLTGIQPKEIAAAIGNVIDNPQIAKAIADKAKQMICEQHTWSAITSRLVAKLDQLKSTKKI